MCEHPKPYHLYRFLLILLCLATEPSTATTSKPEATLPLLYQLKAYRVLHGRIKLVPQRIVLQLEALHHIGLLPVLYRQDARLREYLQGGEITHPRDQLFPMQEQLDHLMINDPDEVLYKCLELQGGDVGGDLDGLGLDFLVLNELEVD